MAISKNSNHARTISLPSLLHPVDASIEERFRRLRSSEAGPSSSSSICKELYDIKDLYEEMNEFIQLPHNQQVLSNEPEVVDGSIALLDMSSSALDALSQLKDAVLDLESALRRGSNSEGIHAYIVSKKKISKSLSKCLVNLKKAEKFQSSAQSEGAVSMLKEAEAICLSSLKSLVSYVMGKKAMSQGRGWSLVAKLVKSKHACHETECISEVEDVDRLVFSGSNTNVLLKKLETLGMAIQDLEDGIESVSRILVKTRVSLLNVLNH